jgi:hypothetical protein
MWSGILLVPERMLPVQNGWYSTKMLQIRHQTMGKKVSWASINIAATGLTTEQNTFLGTGRQIAEGNRV